MTMLLFLDTSDNEQISLALVSPSGIKVKKWQSPSTASETLMETIKKFLKTNKTGLSELSKLGVVTGPGHFSRIRTGVATANALGYALKIPVVGVKRNEILDLKEILEKKGENIAKVYYDKAPNITKAKPKKLKI